MEQEAGHSVATNFSLRLRAARRRLHENFFPESRTEVLFVFSAKADLHHRLEARGDRLFDSLKQGPMLPHGWVDL